MARSPRRIAAALFLSGAVALGVGACSPAITLQGYNPSEGVRGALDTQVKVDNLMMLTAAEEDPGTLLGGLTNNTSEPADVSFSLDGVSGALEVTVDPHSTLLLGPEHESVIVPSVPVPPGAVVQVQMSTPESGSITLSVPVLDGTLPAYDPYVPVTPSESAISEDSADEDSADEDSSDSSVTDSSDSTTDESESADL